MHPYTSERIGGRRVSFVRQAMTTILHPRGLKNLMRRPWILCLLVLFACSEDNATPVETFDPGRRIGPADEVPRDDSGVIVLTDDMGMTEAQCEDGEQRACTEGCGSQVCMNGAWDGECAASPERCNGIDDDCDEAVDEDFESLGLGFSCTTDQENGCKARGINACSDSGDGVTCDADYVEPVAEVCDAADNDCDGSTDEGFPNQVCCTQTSQCPLGQTCSDGICGDPGGGMTGQGGNSGSGGSSGSGSDCDSVLDCNGLEECISGTCREICFTDEDCQMGFDCTCPPGADCLFKVCLPAGSSGTENCTSNQECGLGQACVNGACVNAGNACVDNFDCPNGQECDLELGMCIEVGGGTEPQCTSDFDCGFGEICQNGVCVNSGGGGGICFDDFDCPPGQVCEIIICVPDTGGGSGTPTGDFCSRAQPLSGVGSVAGVTNSGDDNVDLTCGSLYGPDSVYRWQAPSTGQYVFDTVGSSYDTTLAIYSDCNSSGRELTCDDDGAGFLESEVNLNATVGQTYYIVVSGYGSTSYGQYTLNYRQLGGCTSDAQCGAGQSCQNGTCINNPSGCTSDFECNSGQSCQAGVCVDNPVGPVSFCDVVMIAPSTGRTSNSTDAGTDVYGPTCTAFTDGNDVVYRWTPTTTADYVIETEGNTNTIVSLVNDCSGTGQQLACDDDSGNVLNGQFTFSAQAFTSYYIIVSASRSLWGGAFELVITEVQQEPEPECSFDFQCDSGELCSNDGDCVSSDQSNLCAHALYEAIYGPNYPMVITGSMADDVVGNCGNGTSTGGDADFRWFTIRGGEYKLTAHAENAGENVSLAIYDDCGSGNTTTERVCENRWSNADEEVNLTVDIATTSAYRVVVSGRGFNSDGDITLTIESISGGCAN